MTERIEIPERTLPAVLRRNAERAPDDLFLCHASGTVTWSAAHEMSLSTAQGFASAGVVPGDPVVVMLDSCVEFVQAWFGLATLGAVEVPINPQLVGQSLVQRLNHCEAATAVVQSEYVAAIEGVRGDLTHLRRLIVVGEPVQASLPCEAFDEVTRGPVVTSRPVGQVSVGDPVAIMYTSGSTGAPKGVVMPHGQHVVNGMQAVHAAGITSADRIHVALPLHHNMAQGYGIWPSLVAGASVWLAPRFSRADFWADVRNGESTVFPFVGAMLSLLAQLDDDGADNPLRVGYGVPIPAHLHEAFERRHKLRLLHCYGSTEATIVSWTTQSMPGSVGRVLDTFRSRIVDADDLALPPGEIGEICVRPEEPYSCFSGYYHDPERTAETFRNGWLHTGDLGRMDGESNLWFVGRMGDSIRRMGEFVNPLEVEEVISQHPAVALAAVFGVASELGEEEVMASVVPREGEMLEPSELRAWLAPRLTRFAIPRYIDVVTSLPMTSTGKVAKHILRGRGVSNASDDARAASQEAR
jgi:crotonobetaine/carnitine-CoA ligase